MSDFNVPAGLKLVPMRPTAIMLDAAIATVSNRKTYGTKNHTLGQMLAEEWIAMVHAATDTPPAAAPTAQAPSVASPVETKDVAAQVGTAEAIAASEVLEVARASVRAEFALHFPLRKPEIPAEQQGLFEKFIVRRTDGRDEPGCKHENCEYFVLDVDHDEHARAALAAYADAAEKTHPDLASDLRSRYSLAQVGTEDADAQATREIVRLRLAQSAAVMPLIGPLLDAWEHARYHVVNDEECAGLSKQLRAINRAMEDAGDDETAPQPAEAMAPAASAVLVVAELKVQPDIETLTANGEYWPSPWPTDLATSCRVIIRMSKNDRPDGASEDWWAGFGECANSIGTALHASRDHE